MRNLRVGIISAKWGVSAHLPAWRAVPGIEVVGICTAHQDTAEAAARANDIPQPFWNYHDMAASPDIDILDVGTRPNLRYHMCMASLEHGKHVYDGVPFVDSMEHALILHDTYVRSGRVGVVDAYEEFLPPIAFARALVDDGAVGELFSVTCLMHQPLFISQVSTFDYRWFWDRTAGCSALRNFGSHSINILHHLFGDIDSVVAQNELLLKEWKFIDNGEVIQPQVEDTSNVLVRFKTGGVGVLSYAWSVVAGPGFVLDAFGSKGRLRLEGGQLPFIDTKVYWAKLGEKAMTELSVPTHFGQHEGVTMTVDTSSGDRSRGTKFAMAASFATMADAIRNGGKARPNFSQALRMHAVIEAASRSAQENRWVAVQEMLDARSAVA